MNTNRALKFAVGAVALMGIAAASFAQSQTAQSIMVDTASVNGSYIIDGTTTWIFMGQPPHPKSSTFFDDYFDLIMTGDDPGAQVAVFKAKVNHDNRCNFWDGEPLVGDSDSKSTPQAHWTMTAVPKFPGVYAPRTGWEARVDSGGLVPVSVAGFVASESYVRTAINKKSWNSKYSFTLTQPDGLGGTELRVGILTANLQKYDAATDTWATVATNTMTPDMSCLEYGQNWNYFANGGIFGNSAVYGMLHAPGCLGAMMASSILLSDNFNGNNDPLANLIRCHYDLGSFNLSDSGLYRVQILGVLKGNAAIANAPFTVTSSMVEIGGC